MPNLSRKQILISLVFFIVLLFFGIKFVKPISIDENGFYYKNSFGIYTNHRDLLWMKDIGIPMKLEDTDPYDFSVIHLGWFSGDEEKVKYAYAKSKSNIYFNGKTIKGLNDEDFEHVGGRYSKDGNNIYYEEVKVEGIDYESFKTLGESMAVDINGFYYMSHPVLKKTDNQTFESFNPEVTEVITNEKGAVFLQDLSGAFKVGDKIKVKNMDGEYHQAKKSDKYAETVFMTENMTVYSTHILY